MDTMPMQFVSSLLDLRKPNETRVCFKPNTLIYDSRNLLCLTAFENNFDRVLWLDSDMTFPTDTLERLSAVMDEGHDLVTGLYFRRRFPVKPVLYKRVDKPAEQNGTLTKQVDTYLDYPEDTVFPVEGCGFGIVLTSVDLLRRIWDKYGPAFSPFVWASEDISFCYRAKLLGASMVCDSRIPVGHVGTVQFSASMYKRNETEVDE